MAQRAVLQSRPVVVAVGGDGTLNEVVNGLVRAGTSTELATIPLGTGMDFVRTILRDAPAKMSPDAVLVLEIGNERPNFEHAFRRLEVAWLETSSGDDQVLLVTREALARWGRK